MECLLCSYTPKNKNGFGVHLRFKHKISQKEYRENIVQDRPYCKCGCGELVEWCNVKKYDWNEYVNGHNFNDKPPEEQSRWKGGRWKDAKGYIRIRMPSHPKSCNKGYVMEHIAVAEKKIGRYLMGDEVVHHINEIRDDNMSENLEVMTRGEHSKLHREKEKTLMKNVIKCLNKGYVRLVDHMGSDLTVANSARVSYSKESKELSDKDIKLIKFLAREGHTSPFRHASLQFEVYAPLMIARQWWKYVVGSDHTMDAWNESSRRYITEEPEFYIPGHKEWRSAPANSKQGSGSTLPKEQGEIATMDLLDYVAYGERLYQRAISSGVCAEQARLFLPAYGMYVRWYWTASLQSVAHMLNQRLAHDSQKEFQEYAKAVFELVKSHFPVALEELVFTEDL